MDVILEKIKTFSDFLNECTNSDNFPLLKQELIKYKNVDSSKLSIKILKYIFMILGSKEYFNLLFSHQTEHNCKIKEHSDLIYQTLIDKKYDVDILQLLEKYIEQCVLYKKETQDEALKHYFYGYCECDIVGSRNMECYYYDFLEIELQYVRTRIMNDIGTIRGIKGIEDLKQFYQDDRFTFKFNNKSFGAYIDIPNTNEYFIDYYRTFGTPYIFGFYNLDKTNNTGKLLFSLNDFIFFSMDQCPSPDVFNNHTGSNPL